MSETSRIDAERADHLAALYRAAGQDEPPPELDDAIRAAARRAVASKPRLAGVPFSGWRVPLSIAALIVLSVSVVTLMHEEAPDLVAPPHAAAPRSLPEVERKPAEPAAVGESIGAHSRIQAPDSKEAGPVGLKPPQPAHPAIGLRGAARATDPAMESRKQTAAPAQAGDNSLSPARSAPSSAFPENDGPRDSVARAPTPLGRQAGEGVSRRDERRFAESRPDVLAAEPRPAPTIANAPASPPGNIAEPKSTMLSKAPSADAAAREQPRARMQAVPAPVPQPAESITSAGPIYGNLPPETWLDQIEALRKQGRGEEAKASFAEFRRRYPEHPLPAALKEWGKS